MRGFLTAVTAAATLFSVAAVADEVAVPLGDADKGAKVFRKCSSCHQVGPDAKDRVGPALNGIFGAAAGAAEGFKYSKALRRAAADGLIWDYEHLDAYVENPKALVTGTRMNFRGIKDEQDRHDVLAYLRRFSDDPSNIPEAEPTAQHVEVELPPEILAIVGDRDYGEYLASECLTCHQSGGTDDGIPAITHWPEEDFVIAMHAYKRKLRPHPVMQMMASRLSDEEIAALAAYFKDLE
ncbi:c-type cytochrome [Planktotalea sp.]|uniref:c-type cytochrome n=1 Tax=Planktotalea sp. TaxID=2029877 RepID=UPI003D6C1F88